MIVIIQYNAGNTASVKNAVERLGFEVCVTDNHQIIRNAEKVIFPGVGEANTAMQYLKEKGLDKVIVSLQQPVLGICLGLQLLCTSSEENNTRCLDVFKGVSVKKFPPQNIVPHIGWNTIENLKSDIFQDIVTHSQECEADFYFVHSYYASLSHYTTATCNYILPFSAAMQHNNFYATQFHPEKSAVLGEKVLSNFLKQ